MNDKHVPKDDVYLPHLIIHAVVPIVTAPLISLMLAVPLAPILSMILSLPLFDVAIFLIGGIIVGLLIGWSGVISGGSGAVALIPTLHLSKWIFRLGFEVGFLAALIEWPRSFYTQGCCPDSLLAVVLQSSAIGYVVGFHFSSKLLRRNNVSVVGSSGP